MTGNFKTGENIPERYPDNLRRREIKHHMKSLFEEIRKYKPSPSVSSLEDTENFFRDLELLKLGRNELQERRSKWLTLAVIGLSAITALAAAATLLAPRFLPFLSDKSVSEEIKTQTEEVSKRLDTLTRQMAGLVDSQRQMERLLPDTREHFRASNTSP